MHISLDVLTPGGAGTPEAVRERATGSSARAPTVTGSETCSAGMSGWCEIEMMPDMRERGWINARHLTQSGAVAARTMHCELPTFIKE